MHKITKRASKSTFKVPDLMSVAQLIDTACGDPKKFVVNFKLIEVVLVIIAERLKILQRRIKIELPANVDYFNSGSKLAVTEVKIHAKVKKKRRGTSHTKSISSATSRQKQKSSSKAAIVKSWVPTQEIISIPEVGEVLSNSDIMYDMLFTIKSSDIIHKRKSHKVRRSINERLLTKSETSEDEASTKHKRRTKHHSELNKSVDRSSTDKTTVDISKTDTSADESVISFLDKKSSSSSHKASFGLTSSKQRANFPPTPENSMESMDTTDDQYEKLLFVERVSSDEAAAHVGRLQDQPRGTTSRLSIVTEEEFLELLSDVRKLQAQLDRTRTSDVPEQLREILHKDVNLSDGIAILHISARLEASEKAIERMMSIVTDLARTYPNLIVDSTGLAQQVYSGTATSSKIEYNQIPPSLTLSNSQVRIKSQESVRDTTSADTTALLSGMDDSLSISLTDKDYITEEHLLTALATVYDSVTNLFTAQIDKSLVDASTALKNVIKLERQVKAALAVDKQMMLLESTVAKYTDKINSIDTEITFKMIKYQDEILNMQYAIQSAIDNLIQTNTTPNEDLKGKAELILRFDDLQTKLNYTNTIQMGLEETLSEFKTDLEILSQQIEFIRGAKSDRDEVAEGLEEKVGYETLNAMISREIFNAIQGDFEERIGLAYKKFNNQEYFWQSIIDDFVKLLDEKANQTHVMSLNNDIMYHVMRLKSKMLAMYQLVGEHQPTPFTKKMHRDTKCLSCFTPAYVEETVVPRLLYLSDLRPPTVRAPRLPYLSDLRPPTVRAECVKKNKEAVCLPGLPITHARDTRAKVCHRYCSDTSKSKTTASRIPPGTIMKSIGRDITDTRTLDDTSKKPCLSCNKKRKSEKDKSHKKSAAKLTDNVVMDGRSSIISVTFRRRS